MTEPPPQESNGSNILNLGGNGGLLHDPRGDRHSRRDVRDITRLLRFQRENGEEIFSEDEVIGLIRKTGGMAAKADTVRDLKGAMGILFEAVKLEQKEIERAEPQQHEHEHNVGGLEATRAEALGIIRAEIARRERLTIDSNGHDPSTNGHGPVLPP